MTGITPILLLDEVAAHLDSRRRGALFDTLDAMGMQCVMTGVDSTFFDSLGPRAQRFTVQSGKVGPLGTMASQEYELFREAMSKRMQIVCEYDGLTREVCPIILGHSGEEEKALVYQFAGETSDGPVRPPGEWKCFRLAGVEKVEMREGPWHSGKRHSAAQACVKQVDFDVNPDSPYNPSGQL